MFEIKLMQNGACILDYVSNCNKETRVSHMWKTMKTILVIVVVVRDALIC